MVTVALIAAVVAVTIVVEKTEDERTSPRRGTFNVIALGSDGGLLEGSLSSYLVTGRWSKQANETGAFVLLDAGTVLTGLRRAVDNELFYLVRVPDAHRSESLTAHVLRRLVGAYAISHPHLDHTMGLYVAAPHDTPGKRVFGSAATLQAMQDHVFNWQVRAQPAGEMA